MTGSNRYDSFDDMKDTVAATVQWITTNGSAFCANSRSSDQYSLLGLFMLRSKAMTRQEIDAKIWVLHQRYQTECLLQDKQPVSYREWYAEFIKRLAIKLLA